MLEDFEQVIWIPAGGFALCLDAPLCFVGAHEAEREAAHYGHVLGTVFSAITGQVVLEGDVEQPVHALDAPMSAHASGEALDIEHSGADEIACLRTAASVGIFEAGVNLEDGLDVAKARLPRIAALRGDPGDIVGSCIGAGLNAPMSLFERGSGDQLDGRRIAEIGSDVGLQGRVIALEGQQIVGAMADDLVGDLDLTAHGVDGDERPFQLPGLGKLIEQIWDGGDLVGLFGDRELRRNRCFGPTFSRAV